MTSAILSLVTAILPTLLSIVKYFIDKKEMDDATKKTFYDLVASLSTQAPSIYALVTDYELAQKENLEKIKKESEEKK
jgi:hypothetical protein